jgi:hypothetical protein
MLNLFFKAMPGNHKSAWAGLGLCCAASIALGLILSQAAMALTTEQVISLRKAGVSNQTILKMLENETEMRKRGFLGRYAIKQHGGSEIVVYEAKSPRGVVEFHPEAEQEAGGVKPLSAALGIEQNSIKPRASTNKKSTASGKYTVHLYSYKQKSRAQRSIALLKRYGVKADIRTVQIKDKGTWHRVVCGQFSTRKLAKAFGEKLKSQGTIKQYWVINL